MMIKIKYALLIGIISIYPFQNSFSVDTKQSNTVITQAKTKQDNTNSQQIKALPPSIIKNQQDDRKHQEIYKLGCPGNPQHYTQDIEECEITIIKQLEAIQNKYLLAITSQIKEDNEDNPDLLKETLIAFQQENKAWNTLLDKAITATSYHQGGTISNTVALSRRVTLLKLRIHEQWLAWLQAMDGSSTLPEPIFDETF